MIKFEDRFIEYTRNKWSIAELEAFILRLSKEAEDRAREADISASALAILTGIAEHKLMHQWFEESVVKKE